MFGIDYWIEKRAKTSPNRIAIITETGEMTYSQFNQQINRTVTFLIEKIHVQKGDRIAILSHNRIEFIILLFAIAKIQCVAVPLNVRLSPSELDYQLRDSGTSVLFIENGFRELAESLTVNCEMLSIGNLLALNDVSEYIAEYDDEAPYIICYTSGTTGNPKGAVLTQKNMFFNAINNITAIDISSSDRTAVLLPLFHIGGIGLFAFPTFLAGGAVVVMGKFDPKKTLEMIENFKITIVMGVPVIHQAMLEHPQFDKTDLSSVRWFYSGGAPCPRQLIQQFINRGYRFGQGFGLTETSPTVFMLSREDANRKIGSVGKPVLYCDIQLVDEQGRPVKTGEIGQLIVSGGNVMKEYWNNPTATKEALKDGWFYTGDLAYEDEEGFIYISGREKEMIISGGENIYPLEVENTILQLNGIKEVAVVGIKDEKWGEIPYAYVVQHNPNLLTSKEVILHCAKYLGKYKVPKEVIFLNSLPRNATGKIQKNQLTNLGR